MVTFLVFVLPDGATDESAKAGLPGQISYFLNIISVRIAMT